MDLPPPHACAQLLDTMANLAGISTYRVRPERLVFDTQITSLYSQVGSLIP